MIEWTKIVKERNEWVAKNFPDSPPSDSLLGVIEEMGELAHAHLKLKQGIRGTKEEHNAAAKDAIGDLVVYLLGIINHYNITDRVALEMIPPQDGDERVLWSIAFEIGLLAGYQENEPVDHPLLVTMRVNRILSCLRAYCTARYWDFDDIVNQTWAHVKERDWNAHREAGAAKDDPKMGDPESGLIEAKGVGYIGSDRPPGCGPDHG